MLRSTGDPNEREKAVFKLEEIGTKLKTTPATANTEKQKSILPLSRFKPSTGSPSPPTKYKEDALFSPLKKEEATATPSPH